MVCSLLVLQKWYLNFRLHSLYSSTRLGQQFEADMVVGQNLGALFVHPRFCRRYEVKQ